MNFNGFMFAVGALLRVIGAIAHVFGGAVVGMILGAAAGFFFTFVSGFVAALFGLRNTWLFGGWAPMLGAVIGAIAGAVATAYSIRTGRDWFDPR